MPAKRPKDKEKACQQDPHQDARDKAQEAGKEVLAKFEQQVESLTELAEQYLDQGLLGHHCEALQLRDRALETLRSTCAKLGLPPPDARLGATAPAAPTPPPKATAAAATPALVPAPGVAAPAAEGEAVEGPEEDAAWSMTAAHVRYRWRPLKDGGMRLEVEGPKDTEMPTVDIAECAVRLTWHAAARSLTLPLGFCTDVGHCLVVRRRREGLRLLELTLPKVSSSPQPGHGLAESVAGPEGYGVQDGFLVGREADTLRRHLLDLWRSGHFSPGDVEGGGRANAEHASADTTGPALVRSDEHLYVKEQGPVLAFARTLDRAMLRLTAEVPSLEGRRLMRGRPMAAVYAGPGSRYAPHFDAIRGDNGRVLTCILYLNPFWRQGDGAELRLWPSARGLARDGPCREVAPLHGRLVVFLCDGRNLHEVCPVTPDRESEPRLALSCWYYDAEAIADVATDDRPEYMPEAMD